MTSFLLPTRARISDRRVLYLENATRNRRVTNSLHRLTLEDDNYKTITKFPAQYLAQSECK